MAVWKRFEEDSRHMSPVEVSNITSPFACRRGAGGGGEVIRGGKRTMVGKFLGESGGRRGIVYGGRQTGIDNCAGRERSGWRFMRAGAENGA